MDPRYSAQDVVWCTLCKTTEAPMYCEVCHIYLCDECVVKHLADKSQVHKVVTLKHFLSTPKCPHHPNKQCELHCEQCDVPICSQCVITKHKNHDIGDLMESYKQKQEVIRRDLEEMEKSIYPKFQEAASNIQVQRADVSKHSQKLTRALNEQGAALHKEIDICIQQRQREIDNDKSKHLTALDKDEDQINDTINKITQIIQDLESLLGTIDVCLVSKYQSRIEKFKKLPPKVNVTLPNFLPQKINREQLLKQFLGSLSPLSIETEQGFSLPSPGAESSPPDRPLLDVPLSSQN